MKKSIVLLAFLTILVGQSWADPTDPRNNDVNPAFFANSHRAILDIGINAADFTVQNSYIGVPEIIKLASAKSYVLDFNKLYTAIGENGFQYGFELKNNFFTTIHVGGLGIGAYFTHDSSFNSAIPQSLFGILANGNQIDKPISGSSPAYIQSVIKTGLYGSWNMGDILGDGKTEMIAAGKLGFYIPLAYTDGNEASFNYDFLASSTGKITLNAGGNFPLYTALPVGEVAKADGSLDSSKITASAISKAISQGSGLGVDAGVTFRNPETKKALFGGALLNIPISPARVKGLIQASFSSQFTVDNLLTNFSDQSKLITTSSTSNMTVKAGDKAIFIPMRANGFYRLELLPFLAVIPEAEIVFWNPFHFNGGVTADLNLFNRLDLSVGLKKTDFAWKAETNLGLDIYIAELVVNAALSGPDIGSLFSARGLEAGVYLALGF